MNKKAKTQINLDFLKQRTEAIISRQDSKLRFEVELSLFYLLNTLNIQIALCHLSFDNYNFSLLLLNAVRIFRRLFLVLCTSLTMQDPLRRSLKALSLILLFSALFLSLLWALFCMIFEYSYTLALPLVLPFFSMVLASPSKSRYAEGASDCYFKVRQITLQSLQQAYFGGFLPYKLLGDSIVFTFGIYINAFIVLIVGSFGLQVAEYIHRRGPELHLHALTSGCWKKTKTTDALPWNSTKSYMPGQVVKHANAHWQALGQFNVCEPGNRESWWLFLLFEDPLRTLLRVNLLTAAVLGIEAGVVFICYRDLHPSFVIAVASLAYIQMRNLCKFSHSFK